ncbi:hypothetical protein WJX73_003019 [Symbiochloris irregularis]|uniref:Tr-type G domain-containing protein n=1 Tax=Symbiochloris irregularis TaxID=706552 RepID=A0AAW1PR03_9CHLO
MKDRENGVQTEETQTTQSKSSDPSLSTEEAFQASLDHALELLNVEVKQVGEALLTLGGPNSWAGAEMLSSRQMDDIIQAVQKSLVTMQADMTILRRRTLSGTSKADAGSESVDLLVRRLAQAAPPMELRVAIIGNVDSGKSTLVGVLTRSMLDDGRGLARSKVFKHGHEEVTGRTSSIGQHNLCLDAKGNILNDSLFRPNSSGDYIARSSKVVTLVDLAGHERYFKTTAYGLTGHLPDYACLIVGANAGIVGMCKEHFGVALALKVPVLFLVTKVDICPDHVLQHTLAALHSILRKPGVKKKPFMVRTQDDVMTCARHMHTDSLAPIFLTSAVTGQGLDLVRTFYNLLPQRHQWHAKASESPEFIIDETFGVPGVGTVVAGTVKCGVITTASPLVLGPHIGDGTFKPTAIKSIHYKRLPVTKVVAGQTAALALKKVRRGAVRKGMVLVDARSAPVASWEFDADIAILTHATTIQPRYQAVIHCEIVRQAARVVAMNVERLRSGDRATVRFRFLQRPEFLTLGTRFVFREGRTKGIGVIAGTHAAGGDVQAK